jgi:hypothetical protein
VLKHPAMLRVRPWLAAGAASQPPWRKAANFVVWKICVGSTHIIINQLRSVIMRASPTDRSTASYRARPRNVARISRRPCPHCAGPLHYIRTIETMFTGKLKLVCPEPTCHYRDPRPHVLYGLNKTRSAGDDKDGAARNHSQLDAPVVGEEKIRLCDRQVHSPEERRREL